MAQVNATFTQAMKNPHGVANAKEPSAPKDTGISGYGQMWLML
jgi:hypothetical protein